MKSLKLPKPVRARVSELFDPAEHDDVRGKCANVLQHAAGKLSKYIEKNRSKLHAFRIMHPRNRVANLKPEAFEDVFLRGAPESERKLFRKEFTTYLSVQPMQDPASDKFDVVGFWRSQQAKLPYLSKLFLAWLAFPASSTEVERSFRCMNITLHSGNQSMSDDRWP